MINDSLERVGFHHGSYSARYAVAAPVTAPVRVLIFDHTAALGGGEQSLVELVRRFDPNRVTPIVVLGSHGPLEALLQGHVPLHVLPMDADVVQARRETLGRTGKASFGVAGKTLRYARRLASFLEEHKIDIIHANSLKACIVGGLAGRLANRKVVWHLRDRISPDYLPGKAVAMVQTAAKLLPHFVIGNSGATLRTLQVRGRPTAIVPSGVDLAKFYLEESAIRCAGETVIGLVGRICPWKGQHIFIEAAHKVHKEHPEARFQIIGGALFGEHDYEQELQQQVKAYGLEQVIQFTGFQTDIAPWVRALDIVVHASIIGEPFGQVIVQGMACSKPVIATNGGGVPETMLDGATGLLVPMGDADAMAAAMRRFLTEPEMARRLGEQARQHVEQHFSIEESARKVTAIYEHLAAGRKMLPVAARN